MIHNFLKESWEGKQGSGCSKTRQQQIHTQVMFATPRAATAVFLLLFLFALYGHDSINISVLVLVNIHCNKLSVGCNYFRAFEKKETASSFFTDHKRTYCYMLFLCYLNRSRTQRCMVSIFNVFARLLASPKLAISSFGDS